MQKYNYSILYKVKLQSRNAIEILSKWNMKWKSHRFITQTFFKIFILRFFSDVNWGSSTQGQTYVSALNTSLNLVAVEEHVKNYRPQILILSGPPGARPPLIDFANQITKNVSLLMCGHILKVKIIFNLFCRIWNLRILSQKNLKNLSFV